MRERPILFSGPMVRAILEGQKTQTRRIYRPHRPHPYEYVEDNQPIWMDECGDYHPVPCPYGVPGDRLWVRETWLEDPPRNGTWADVQYFGCKNSPLTDIPERYRSPQFCLYREGWTGSELTWRPSIHMPRWASRITLEITDVRVQRVQETTNDDAIAEGFGVAFGPGMFSRAFDSYWDEINGKKAPWSSNPWVWAITFHPLPNSRQSKGEL